MLLVLLAPPALLGLLVWLLAPPDLRDQLALPVMLLGLPVQLALLVPHQQSQVRQDLRGQQDPQDPQDAQD